MFIDSFIRPVMGYGFYFITVPTTNPNLVPKQNINTDNVVVDGTITTSVISAIIGAITAIGVLGRWYLKLIPVLRRWFPGLFKSEFDEWLEQLFRNLLENEEQLHIEDISNEKEKLYSLLSKPQVVADLIKLDPEEIHDYLVEQIQDTEQNQNQLNSTDKQVVMRSGNLSESSRNLNDLEIQADMVLKKIEQLGEVTK